MYVHANTKKKTSLLICIKSQISSLVPLRHLFIYIKKNHINSSADFFQAYREAGGREALLDGFNKQ